MPSFTIGRFGIKKKLCTHKTEKAANEHAKKNKSCLKIDGGVLMKPDCLHKCHVIYIKIAPVRC